MIPLKSDPVWTAENVPLASIINMPPYSATGCLKTYRLNNIGDQTPPCGTPVVTGYKEDSCLFATTKKHASLCL